MNGLVSAAAEAEEILKKARWSSNLFDLNDELESDDTSIEHNTSSWAGEHSYTGSFGRKRPMEQYSSHGYSPGKRERSSQSLSPVKKPVKFNIHNKLRELYDELTSHEALQANYQGLKISSYLLEKLLTRMNLNVLIINLYPGNKGYSISLKVNGDTQMLSPPNDGSASAHSQSDDTLLETARWPYEEEDLLTYIDNEELPIVLLDLLEAEHSSLFYSGCIIAQIRDYRQAFPIFVCDTHHVLLKPTTQSIISDVNAIARAGSWGREERLLLEAAVVRATAPPLCLEPRPAVGLLAARLHHQRHLLTTPAIKRQARRYSQVAVNRKRRLDQLTNQRGLGLLDIINKHRARAASRQAANPTAATRASSKYPKKPSEVIRPIMAPRCPSPVLAGAEGGEAAAAGVGRLARAYERPRPTADCAPQLLEEYVLEAERPGAGLFHVRLSVLQRPANQEYLGELYVDRDHVEGERNGSACRFLLGTRTHANRYIQQFTEIFTEEGRKSVRIKHLVPGQQPRVSYTAGMREMGHANQQLAARAQGIGPTPTPTAPSAAGVPAVSPSGGAPPSPEVALPLPAGPRRPMASNLPLLVRRITGQLQAGTASVQQLQSVNQPAASPSQLDPAKSQQPAPTIQHIQLHQPLLKQPNSDQQIQNIQITQPTAAQLQQIQNAQQTANQLLAQQLTNPPQPINPHKLQQAIIHIQHPISGQLLQQKVVTSQAQIQGQGTPQHVTIQTQPGITLQGQQSGITLQGQQGGITLQGQQGSITLQGQQGGITLQGQQGITLQGQQGITLQGQQGITLQGQQGIALQGQQGITLQGQQGITLQGQQGITLQGQQGITLQGQQGSITLQGQQGGITLQGQPGIAIQGQQSITLQGQPGSITLQGQQGGITLQGQQGGITLQGQALQSQQGVNVNLQQQGITLQGQSVNLQGQQTISLANQQVNNVPIQVTQKQKVTPTMQRTTNPAISALVTSLMNSAHQFQQAAAANAAAKSTSNNANPPSNNATILNLLNSAPAAMTNSAPGEAAGAGAGKKVAGAAQGGGGASSALLERLMAPPAPSPGGMQNVQVQIPGLPQPISLSLSSAGGAPAGLLVSVPVSSQAPSPTQSLLSLPITQLMAREVKSGTPLQLQLQRPRVAPRQLPTKLPNTATVTAGSVQYMSPLAAAAHQQRRRTNPNEPGK